MRKSIIGVGAGLGLSGLAALVFSSSNPPVSPNARTGIGMYNGHPYAVTQQINGGNRQVVLERIRPGINPNIPPSQSVPRYIAFVIDGNTVKQVIYGYDGEPERQMNVSYPVSADSMLVRIIENSQQ